MKVLLTTIEISIHLKILGLNRKAMKFPGKLTNYSVDYFTL